MTRGVVVLWLALAMGGCAATVSTPDVSQVTQQTRNWIVQGRIGIQTDEQTLSGTFHWQHREESDELLLTSPLGQGVARIVARPAGVTLELPNQPERFAADAETLTRDSLGYALPVSGLVWWVQAQPAPGRVSEARRDAAGRLVQLKQDGWAIEYQYAADASVRPRKIWVARNGLEIRLVADRWINE